MDVLVIAAGFIVVAGSLLDAFDTLLATNIRAMRWSAADAYYRLTWRIWRTMCVRIRKPARRERLLALFGPASFVGLLFLWTVGQIIGWSLVWWGLRDSFISPIENLGEAIYYSGVVYFSIGFGDVLPSSGALRLLTVLEAFGGLGTLGLVIGYLPTLSGAYQARERQLLLLDDLTDTRITPVSLIRSRVNAGDPSEVEAMFAEWEIWCAEVFESHSSLPVLVLFRSKHPGHSWVTALGVVTDAAVVYMAAVPGTELGPAMRLYRQSVRLVSFLAERSAVRSMSYPPTTPEAWEVGYRGLQGTGLVLRSSEESLRRLEQLRFQFKPEIEAFIDELLAPRGFWGVTAAEHMADIREGELFDEP